MRKAAFFLLALSAFSALTYGQEKQVYANDYYVKIGDLAPDFIIHEAEGKTYRLSELRGKVVMLQFTASWCSVCRKEMPFIEKEIWQPKKSSGLVIIGIDRDEAAGKVTDFRKAVPVTYPLALDPGAEIFSMFARKDAGVTRNVIIGRNGKIIFLTRLFDRDEFNKMKSVIFRELDRKD
jgi:peroxiredoxin